MKTIRLEPEKQPCDGGSQTCQMQDLPAPMIAMETSRKESIEVWVQKNRRARH